MDYELQRKRLVDEKSRIYFDARHNYIKDRRLSTFYKNIRHVGEKYKLREVEEFAEVNSISSWVVWGTDDYALYNYMLLKDCGYDVLGVAAATTPLVNELKQVFISTDSLIPILSNRESGLVVNKRDLSQLPDDISRRDNILIQFSHIVGRNGWQYFDYFSPDEMESFVDAGSLNGTTTIEFIKWCNGKYENVYAFEPNPIMTECCQTNLAGCGENIIFFKKALWNEECILKFDNSSSKWDAHIDTQGTIYVKADSIDHLLAKKRITFIKFDIEGSEKEALHGAEKCIIKNKPRMAISVYHNEYDLFEIIEYLSRLIPEYKFAIRHYHSDCIETILYVYV